MWKETWSCGESSVSEHLDLHWRIVKTLRRQPGAMVQAWLLHVKQGETLYWGLTMPTNCHTHKHLIVLLVHSAEPSFTGLCSFFWESINHCLFWHIIIKSKKEKCITLPSPPRVRMMDLDLIQAADWKTKAKNRRVKSNPAQHLPDHNATSSGKALLRPVQNMQAHIPGGLLCNTNAIFLQLTSRSRWQPW